MTVKQVSALTGVSVRTLQYYDDIGLLCPARGDGGGYRLYDEAALETLQQILFFRELGFKLKEIQAILQAPHFDRTAALRAQRELLAIKRERLSGLLHLLDRLLKGEHCMSFAEFDMSEYFRVLEGFKKTHADEIVRRFGSMERFEEDVYKRQEQASSDAMAARFALPVSEFSFFSSPGAAILSFLKKRKKRMGAQKAGGGGSLLLITPARPTAPTRRSARRYG